MSDSNNPTLQPPDAYRTQVNLRDVLAELLDEKFTAFKQELIVVIDEKLAPIHGQLNRLETEMAEFKKEMRLVGKKLDVLNDQHLNQRAEQRLLDDRVTALEAKPV